ncbi:MAG TPA: CvpA family protein [Acidiferrobacteraceae bacterium]|nr:CvpA family protein [Acidiferrobacteraceae bacterium]
MNELDIVISVLVVVSALIGVFRGFVREVLSVMSWALAAFLAWTYKDVLGPQVLGFIDTPRVQILAAAALIFVVALVLATIISYLIHKLVDAAGLGALDRVLGLGFGVLRGGLIVAALAYVASTMALTKEALWKESTLAAQFQPMGQFLADLVPADIERSIASR